MTTNTRILVCDDDPAILRGVGGMLQDEGYVPVLAEDVRQAEARLAAPGGTPDLLLLDLRMPGESGLALLQRLPRPLPFPVVVLSGEASPTDAVTALRLGAADFVEKPPSPERLLTSIRNALALHRLREEGEELRRALALPGNLVGDSPKLEELRQLVVRVGATDAVVLIQGETGAGKERVARALHVASARKGRFVAVNCAAIPEALLESELFGHERGAFTGANVRRLGRFEQADGGTLLLDEIGDMPLSLQAKLLRVLEQREIERLGGSGPVPIDVRVLAATHRDLRQAVAGGQFRQDLYFRLAVFPLRVPPLRERAEDVLPLIKAFAAELIGADAAVTVTPEGQAALRAHPFPGNVRELRNFVERLVLLRGRGPLFIDAAVTAVLALGDPLPPTVPGQHDHEPDGGDLGGGEGGGGEIAGLGEKGYRALVDDFERGLVRAALERTGGNVAAAARLLKVDRGNLYRRVQALGLTTTDVPDTSRPPER
jgi:two-component system nitrogen regulation response regulator NtrX